MKIHDTGGKDRFAPRDYEKAFLDNPADSFAIYQLRDSGDAAQLRYMNYEYLEKKDFLPKRRTMPPSMRATLTAGAIRRIN